MGILQAGLLKKKSEVWHGKGGKGMYTRCYKSRNLKGLSWEEGYGEVTDGAVKVEA